MTVFCELFPLTCGRLAVCLWSADFVLASCVDSHVVSRACIRLDQCVSDTMAPGAVVRLVPIGPMSDSTNMCWLLTVSTVDDISGCGR